MRRATIEMAASVVVAERQSELVVVERDDRADERGDGGDRQRQRVLARRYNHPFIVWADSSIGFRRSLLRLAPGSLPGRAPRFVDSLASRNRRPAGDLDGRAAQGAAGAVRRERDDRIDRRMSRALLHRPARAATRWCASAFSPARVDRTLATFRRYGVMAVLIPSILPPPAPFKIFVLLAGVARNRGRCSSSPPSRSVAARAISAEGLLALWYGEQAMVFIRENGTPVALASSACWSSALVGYILWRKAGQRPPIIRYINAGLSAAAISCSRRSRCAAEPQARDELKPMTLQC